MTEATITPLQSHSLTQFGEGSVETPTLKSLLLEIRRGDIVLGTATGALLSRTKETHCALFTNRHVVTVLHQETGHCLDRRGALPDHVAIYFHEPHKGAWNWKSIVLPLYRESGEPFWIEHPRLGAAADEVALNLKWGSDVAKFPYYLNTSHDRVGMSVRPAEPVSVIGFPFGLTSAERFPIWSTGFLAHELSLVPADRPYFLIDCRTRPGQSGSPVIAFRTGGHRVQEGTQITATFGIGTAWEFLGIYSGRINAESDLGRVWHVSALGELLDAAAADYERRLAPKF